jgi:hypothetical protein
MATESELPAPRPRRASLLWAAGAALLLYSAILAATGGIDVTLGGLRIRSRTWQRPALIGLACVLVVAVADRRRARTVALHLAAAAARSLDKAWPRLSPRVIAGVAALATLVIGVAFGTFTAGGADSSGYLNQAKLFARGRLVDEARVREQPPWPDPLFKLAPLGYRPASDRQHLSPIYPPGYPLLMAPLFLIGERAANLVVPICGALALWWTFALGRRLGEPGAGASAALLVAASPTFLFQLTQPMSDVPATAAWLLALYLSTSQTVRGAVGAGLTSAIAILIRPNLMPLAGLIWIACVLADRSGRRWQRGAAAAVATMPGVIALGVIQSIRYGSWSSSGYASMRELFAWSNIGPNLDRYPRWMFESHTPLVALFLIAPWWILRRRDESRWLFLVLWVFAVAVVLAYLPYVYFQPFEWTYTRFLLPGLPIMWLLTFVPFAQWLRRVRPAVAMLVAVPALACLLAFSIAVARNRDAFGLRTLERKYELAGDFARRDLPANAILISMQHSGSLWFYARRPILRWDNVDPNRFAEALAWSSAQGYAPCIVADRAEMEQMKIRFGEAAFARARPLARFGDATVYELASRD